MDFKASCWHYSEALDTADETPPSSFGKLADGEDDDNEDPGTSYESLHDGGNYYYNNGFKVISNYVIADFKSQSLSDTSESGQVLDLYYFLFSPGDIE